MIESNPIVVAGTVGNTTALEENGPFTESYLTGWYTVQGDLTAIFAYSNDWIYCKVGKRQRKGMKGYLSLYDQFLLPNNVDHMEYLSENSLQNAVYHREKNNNTFDKYVMIQKELHIILENLEQHGYKIIDDHLKVQLLLAGIKYGSLKSVKSTILASAPYRQDYDVSVILYKYYIKQAQDTNTELNILGVGTRSGD